MGVNKWILWTVICIICISILLYIGTFFRYPGRKLKAHTSIYQIQQENYLYKETTEREDKG
ncbi:hypothetical protein SAMN02745975_03258 [Geosporobacter subterraneus DSM 17957]|uniref:Uncharacterized protein n=1 Tax=Geosporobacter subterraneus DSM 17957 TaxID=1121919 RepID=A0A1M6NC03_9FIRM|nr:hypothetical protein SAMN02745975_03258 [Geosporobacter subterraneus DSM 17957]